MRLRFKILSFAFLLTAWGCASPEYRYVPTGANAGVDRFRGDATFPVKDSSGNVRVTSLGVEDIKPKGSGDKIPALHLRMAVSNQSTSDWQLHLQDQTVSFPNHPGPVVPEQLADISIPSKSLQSIDLFYALPSGRREAQDLPEFDFHWKVRQGEGVVEHSISFARQQLPEYVASGSYPYAWGPSFGPFLSYRQ